MTPEINRIEIKIKMSDEGETPATVERGAYVAIPPMDRDEIQDRLEELLHPIYRAVLVSLHRWLEEQA